MPANNEAILAPERVLSTMDWRREFDIGTLHRGQAYQLRERASLTAVRIGEICWFVDARVRGSRSTPYQTTVSVPFPGHGGKLGGNCNCPVGKNCKHVVAVLETLAASENVPKAHGPAPKSLERPREESHQVSVPLRHWIESTLTEDRPKVVTPAVEVAPAAVVRYSFHGGRRPDQGRGGLVHITILAFPSRSLKSGAGQTIHGRGAKDWELPDYFTEDDVRFAREMRSLTSPFLPEAGSYSEMRPHGRFWGMLCSEIVASGRAIWDGDPKAVLKIGPERVVVPCWQDLGQAGTVASLSFQDSGAPAVWLHTEPPYCIDPAARTISPAKWEAAVPVPKWLAAPPIPPAQLALVSERMAAAGWPLGLRPSRLEVRELSAAEAPLIPRLVLTRVNLEPAVRSRMESSKGDGFELASFPVLRFEVRYGELRVDNPVSNRTSVATMQTKTEILRVRRDLDREEQWLGKLALLEVEPLFTLYDFRADSGEELVNAFSMPPDDGMPGEMRRDWFRFLGLLPDLRALGWEIDVDPSFGLCLQEPTSWWSELEEERTNDWFRFDSGVEIDGRRVSLINILRTIAQRIDPEKDLPWLLEADESTVVPVELGDEGVAIAFPARRLGMLLSSLLQLFEQKEAGDLVLHRLAAAQLATQFADGELTGETVRTLRALGTRLSDFKGIARVKAPRTLKASLRPYQVDGLSWLQFLREHRLGGVLADDMGLGKTVQTLAHLLVERGAKRADLPSLIVAPTSVVSNWAAEAARFAPSLRVLVLQGPERKELFARIPKADLVITSFALLPRDSEEIQAHQYHYVILDEAQYIKNPASKMSQEVCALRARHRLCLSGTPMENHLGELWSLFQFLMPGFLGDRDAFRRHWRRPIEQNGDESRRDLLAKRVAPLMLRRTRGQVLHDLPPRTDIVRSVSLDRAQAELYEVVRAAMDKKVREAIAAKGLAQSQIIVLDALLKLRQICCDPRLLKLPAARKVKESAKLDLFRELVGELASEGRRILVFSQFTSMLELIGQALDDAEITWCKLTGDTPGTERAKLVASFQEGRIPVFLISLKAGGSGLNLTAADTVIHYDPWWNPAVEEQATGRAHRMGQANPVFVYRLITEGTIEERILELQQRKAAIANAILEGSTAEPGRGLAIERADLEHLLAPL